MPGCPQKEQHLDRQIKALLDHGIDDRDIVTDHASGASLERPGYTALKGTMLRMVTRLL